MLGGSVRVTVAARPESPQWAVIVVMWVAPGWRRSKISGPSLGGLVGFVDALGAIDGRDVAESALLGSSLLLERALDPFLGSANYLGAG